ncbi:unnamed protein product (macronuclear) [Paramecium tetraurelia]|uniref:Selenoprotein T n=1 Tax=Paramecium tetraurelia TaxID=5888 RepID=A0BEI8_PARTE|nr:uncharacterized protein GSPATT00027988001 [Paramecium tetraurelia]CAK56955.1 unnamed protein product [Paramecium tetraurelia]|eukprot:XP_001424353.1 hypothetical protein (macronuclear) [Paramecium tetraurelia strain d4-2]
MQQAIFSQFDERVEVMGMPYPLGQGKEILVQLLTIIQYGFIAGLIFFDKQISEMSNFWRTNISPSRLKYGFLGYIALNFVITQLSSSGAFEIFVNDQLVHSKISSGQMPTMDTLFRIVRERLQ